MLASSVLRTTVRNGLRTSRISGFKTVQTTSTQYNALRALSSSAARMQELDSGIPGEGLAPPPPPTSAFAGARAETVPDAVKEAVEKSVKEAEAAVSDVKLEHFSQLRELGLVDRSIIDVLVDGYGYDKMTDVQSATIAEALKGHDILAQAKTGTGKTIGFLLPVLQRLVEINKVDPLKTPARFSSRERRPAFSSSGNADIRAIIISPTRELAEQIHTEAVKLCRNTNFKCQLAVGGTQKREALQKVHREGCNLLIGTPGRLKDLLSDPQSGVTAPKLQFLVLDEADNLLDAGFSDEIMEIAKLLPKRDQVDRQTLLFSATVPKKVMAVVKTTLKRDYKHMNMVDPNEEPTHLRVPQHLIRIKSFENTFPTLLELCQKEQAAHAADPSKPPFKAIVFFSCVRFTKLAHDVFANIQRPHPLEPAKLIEIHSGLTQAARTKAAERFKRAESAILFSSDVVARGMDFPNVTHVIQVGQPRNTEQYVHRVGRTGRAGKEGNAFLMLTHVELPYAQEDLAGLPLKEHSSLHTAKLDLTQEAELPKTTVDILTSLSESFKDIDHATFNAAYISMIGAYGHIKNKAKLIEGLNAFSTLAAGRAPPKINPALAQKMGLTRVPGITLHDGTFDERSERRPDRNSFGRGGDRGGDRGGFNKYGGDRGERKSFGGSSFGGDRPPRRSYGEDGERPQRRSYGEDGERPQRRSYGDSSDRPQRRSYGEDGERPQRRSYSDSSDRPQRRSYGEDGDRPRKSYGDKFPSRDSKPKQPWEGRGKVHKGRF